MSMENKQSAPPSASREEIDACFASVSPGSGPLDGQSFEAEATEKGKDETEPLHLIFRRGALLAVECMPYAFGAGSYSTETVGDGSIEFTSEIRSLEHETEKHLWKGRVGAGEIAGTMTWTDREGKTTEFTFHGRSAGVKG